MVADPVLQVLQYHTSTPEGDRMAGSTFRPLLREALYVSSAVGPREILTDEEVTLPGYRSVFSSLGTYTLSHL
jgi:hypothetical protein